MAKATVKKVAARTEPEDETTQSFVEAGFSVEQVGITIIYHRPVSKDVREASKAIAGGRSVSCPPKRSGK